MHSQPYHPSQPCPSISIPTFPIATFTFVLVLAVAVAVVFAQRLFPLSTIRQIALSENLYEADLKFDLESKCKRFLSANIL